MGGCGGDLGRRFSWHFLFCSLASDEVCGNNSRADFSHLARQCLARYPYVCCFRPSSSSYTLDARLRVDGRKANADAEGGGLRSLSTSVAQQAVVYQAARFAVSRPSASLPRHSMAFRGSRLPVPPSRVLMWPMFPPGWYGMVLYLPPSLWGGTLACWLTRSSHHVEPPSTQVRIIYVHDTAPWRPRYRLMASTSWKFQGRASDKVPADMREGKDEKSPFAGAGTEIGANRRQVE